MAVDGYLHILIQRWAIPFVELAVHVFRFEQAKIGNRIFGAEPRHAALRVQPLGTREYRIVKFEVEVEVGSRKFKD